MVKMETVSPNPLLTKQEHYISLVRCVRWFKDTEDAYLIPRYEKAIKRFAEELGENTPTDIMERWCGSHEKSEESSLSTSRRHVLPRQIKLNNTKFALSSCPVEIFAIITFCYRTKRFSSKKCCSIKCLWIKGNRSLPRNP